jgi:mannosyltransferase OCH1-like enzyme
MIPSILFTYWEGDQLSILHYFSLYSVCKYNLNFKIIIYTSKNLTSKFIEWKTGEHSVKFNECYSLDDFVKIINNQKNIIEVIPIDFEQEYKINNDISCVHKADIIRIIKLYEHGGIWFDMDILFIKPIPKNLLEDESELLLFLDCETVPTGLIFSSKMNKFIEQMYKFILNNNLNLNSYQILGPHCWNHFYNNNSTNTSIKILPNEYAYPYNWITIKNFFDLNDESFIKNNTFCIHWFNGGSNTKEFINKFDKNNITNNTTCEIILKKIISSQ